MKTEMLPETERSLGGALKISVIVTTYQWPYALRMILTALAAQKTDHPFEIIIADVGSGEETAALIQSFKKRVAMPVLHIAQPDEGYRAATIRNKAILTAAGDYLIFLEGDCIPREDFIERHAMLAEPKTFVTGNRILLSKAFTLKVLSEAENFPLHQWSLWRWLGAYLMGKCNRLLPLFSLSLQWWNRKTFSHWKGAKACNLAVWKTDIVRINGWEELFVGGGYEDSDLAYRLLKSGIQRKSGRFQIPVIHLWHGKADKTVQQQNKTLFKNRQIETKLRSTKGVTQYGAVNV